MSIAELIMTGTERASKSTDWVADSLAKIGDNVSKVLVDREQQKQAQEMLPMFQQGLKDAMINANEGDAGLAYSKLMPFLTDPATAKNPYFLRPIENAIKLIDASATQYARNIQVQAYRDRYSGGGGGGEPRMPQGPASFFNQPSSTTEENYSGEGDGMGGAGNVDKMPANQPVAYLQAEVDKAAAEGLPVMGGAAAEGQKMMEEEWSFTMAGYNPPSKDLQKKAIKDNEKFINSTAEQQQEFKNSVSSTANPRGTEFIETSGLSNFKGFEDITGLYIPKETYIEFPESLSLQEDDKGSKWTTKFVKKTVNQQQMDMANKLAYTDLPTAIRRINDNQTLQRFFTENTTDKLDVGEKKSEDGNEFVGYIGIRGTDNYINLSKDDLAAARIITGLPSTSKTLLSPLAKAERPTAPKAPAETVAPTERPNLMDIAMGKPVTPSQQKGTAPSASTLDTAKINPENPFAKDAKKELETQALAKQVGETMRTQAKQITSTRQARDRIKEIDIEIGKIKSKRKGTGPMLGGLELSQLNVVEKYQLAEKLLSEKKKLESFLASN
jgi:hypothetical protein